MDRALQRAGAPMIAFDEVTDLLGVTPLLDRSPRNLSGGERQRVAIGRALLSQPKLLLMDEPLSALDRVTKAEILPFLERLRDRLSLPIVYITHDIAEVERLADQVVLMEKGHVLAAGPLADLQSDPSLPLAMARDAAVTLDATVEAYDAAYGLLTLTVRGGRFIAPARPMPVGEHRRSERCRGRRQSRARAARPEFDPQHPARARRRGQADRRQCDGRRRVPRRGRRRRTPAFAIDSPVLGPARPRRRRRRLRSGQGRRAGAGAG